MRLKPEKGGVRLLLAIACENPQSGVRPFVSKESIV